MEEPRNLTVTSLHPRTKDEREADGGRLALDATLRSMLAKGFDAAPVAEIALEWLLGGLDFERGFLFVIRAGDEPGEEPEVSSLEPLASRARQGTAATPDWSPVKNPEFAVQLSAIKRALGAGGLLVLKDCLLQPTGQGEEVHRTVVCLPFRFAPRIGGVLYLDRGLGKGDVGERAEGWIEDFVFRCLPIIRTAFLATEVDRLRSAPPAGAEASEDSEDSGDDADRRPAPEAKQIPTFHGIVGEDEKLRKVFRVIEKIKDTDLNVCIFGESGTGKELLAKAIHASSRRSEKPFVAENCGAIPENLLESELFGHVKGSFTGADEDRKGLFEIADGGTLFLDEIGDMSEGMQRNLLRVLQDGVIRPIGGKSPVRVDVRVICASNRDLRVLVQKNCFRADLFFRLNVINLEIPPLRERSGDVPLLVAFFARKVAEEESIRKRFSVSALRALCEYSWPGNVRELTNVVRRVLLTSAHRVIPRKDVAALLSSSSASPRSGENMERDDQELILHIPVRDSFNEIVEECERVVLLNSLRQCAWNKSRVTKALKIPRQSLYNKIAKYRLERTWGGGAEGGLSDHPRHGATGEEPGR